MVCGRPPGSSFVPDDGPSWPDGYAHEGRRRVPRGCYRSMAGDAQGRKPRGVDSGSQFVIEDRPSRAGRFTHVGRQIILFHAKSRQGRPIADHTPPLPSDPPFLSSRAEPISVMGSFPITHRSLNVIPSAAEGSPKLSSATVILPLRQVYEQRTKRHHSHAVRKADCSSKEQNDWRYKEQERTNIRCNKLLAGVRCETPHRISQECRDQISPLHKTTRIPNLAKFDRPFKHSTLPSRPSTREPENLRTEEKSALRNRNRPSLRFFRSVLLLGAGALILQRLLQLRPVLIPDDVADAVR